MTRGLATHCIPSRSLPTVFHEGSVAEVRPPVPYHVSNETSDESNPQSVLNTLLGQNVQGLTASKICDSQVINFLEKRKPCFFSCVDRKRGADLVPFESYTSFTSPRRVIHQGKSILREDGGVTLYAL